MKTNWNAGDLPSDISEVIEKPLRNWVDENIADAFAQQMKDINFLMWPQPEGVEIECVSYEFTNEEGSVDTLSTGPVSIFDLIKIDAGKSKRDRAEMLRSWDVLDKRVRSYLEDVPES